MTPVRVGVWGVGVWGEKHARVYHALPQADLVGVYDRDAARAAAVVGQYGGRVFESPEALLDACEAVSVAVPTVAHREATERTAAAGRHVLVEKPMAVTVAEADAMIAAAQRAGVTLQVGQVERFNPGYIAARAHVDRPKFVEAHRLAVFQPRSLDVDVVFDLMIHDIDLVLHLIGEEPSHIHAAGAAVISDDLDICNARMEFPRGAVANLTASRISTFGMRKFRIFAEQAYVALDLKEKNLEYYRLYPSASSASGARAGGMIMPFGDRGQVLAVERREGESEEMLKLELGDFVRAVQGGTPPPVDGRAGARALGVAEQVHRQAHELLQRAHLG